jgi:hypothetical protein
MVVDAGVNRVAQRWQHINFLHQLALIPVKSASRKVRLCTTRTVSPFIRDHDKQTSNLLGRDPSR